MALFVLVPQRSVWYSPYRCGAWNLDSASPGDFSVVEQIVLWCLVGGVNTIVLLP